MLDELLEIYFHIQICFRVFLRTTLHSTSSNIDSYGHYLYAIFMDIYHELSEYPITRKLVSNNIGK